MKKPAQKIQESVPQIQRLTPALPVHRIVLLVPSQPYGSEGLQPVDERTCPYFQQHGCGASCISASGGSLCGGFHGTTAAGETLCTWLPRWLLPGQRLVVLPADEAMEPQWQAALWN